MLRVAYKRDTKTKKEKVTPFYKDPVFMAELRKMIIEKHNAKFKRNENARNT